MNKQQLLSQIRAKEGNLSNLIGDKAKYEKKYENIISFLNSCNRHTDDFNQSINQRKQKLNHIEGLASRMKTAVRYRQKMNEMLNGNDFSSTVSSINQLFDTINREKNKILETISNIEWKINKLERDIIVLKNQYRAMSEEG